MFEKSVNFEILVQLIFQPLIIHLFTNFFFSFFPFSLFMLWNKQTLQIQMVSLLQHIHCKSKIKYLIVFFLISYD